MNSDGLSTGTFLSQSLKHWWQSARCLLSETPTWLCWHWEEVVAEVEEHSSHPHLQVRLPWIRASLTCSVADARSWVPNHALGCSIVERVPDLDSHASSLQRKAQDIKALPAAAAELPGTRHFREHPSRSRRVHSWDWQAHRLLAQYRHAASWLWERASGATNAHRAGKGPVIRRFQDLFRAPGSAGGAGGCCAGGAGNAC